MAEQPSERLKRINELAKKKKTEGLTAAETAEQDQLRKAYIADFRAGFRQQVESLKIVDKNGKEVTPQKVIDIQRKKGLRKD
jgi:uncharacterized protein YnzC (UPF0291/DUF896 family)